MDSQQNQFGQRRSSAPHRLKEAMLTSFQSSADVAWQQLLGYSQSGWQAILVWLDISGTASYLFDRLRGRGIQDSAPAAIRECLRARLEGDRQRRAALLLRARSVACNFDAAGLRYGLMKGITMTPDSLPDPAPRWQTDLDFLIYESDSTAATEILRGLGYEQHATNGSTIELRSGPSGKPGLANLYRADMQRSLELHCLQRRSWCNWHYI